MRVARRSRWNALAAFAALASILVLPASGIAQQGTRPLAAVLGLVSEEGDDDVATSLTSAFRTAVAQLDTITLDSREITLSQMMLAHGCAEPDAECLTKIAATLNVQKVFFGTMRRMGESYQVRFHVYNTASRSIGKTVEDSIPAGKTQRDELGDRTLRYVADLEGIKLLGRMQVRANVPNAAIEIDGRQAGELSDEGFFETELEPGNHDVVVKAEGHATYRQTVSVIANQGAKVEVFLQPEGTVADDPDPSDPGSDSASLSWLGWGLIGLGAAGVGLTVVSSIVILGLNDDPTFVEFRRDVDEGTDACDAADRETGTNASPEMLKSVRSTCSQASLFEALWWVGLGVGVAATGAGIVILLTDDSDDSDDADADADAASLTILPRVTSERGMLEARIRF